MIVKHWQRVSVSQLLTDNHFATTLTDIMLIACASDQCIGEQLVICSGYKYEAELIPGLHPANERRRYKVTPSLIGWAQT